MQHDLCNSHIQRIALAGLQHRTLFHFYATPHNLVSRQLSSKHDIWFHQSGNKPLNKIRNEKASLALTCLHLQGFSFVAYKCPCVLRTHITLVPRPSRVVYWAHDFNQVLDDIHKKWRLLTLPVLVQPQTGWPTLFKAYWGKHPSYEARSSNIYNIHVFWECQVVLGAQSSKIKPAKTLWSPFHENFTPRKFLLYSKWFINFSLSNLMGLFKTTMVTSLSLPPLHCRLKICDTTNNVCSKLFGLPHRL